LKVGGVNLGKWIGLLTVVVSLYILWQIRQVLLLAFLAVILATALNRFVRRLQLSGVRRGIGVTLVAGLCLALLGLLVMMIVPPITEETQQLITLIPEGMQRIQVWLDSLQNRIPQRLFETINPIGGLAQRLQTVAVSLISHFYAFFYNLLEILLNALLVIVLTIMLLGNPLPYRRAFIRLFPAFYRQQVDYILQECEVGLIGWLAGVLLSMTFISLVSGIGLWLLQVPLPLVNALLAGFLALIPYLGAILSAIPPIALALLDAPWKAGAVLILYFLIQQIEGNFVTPVIMEKQVSLLPATTLALMTAAGAFFGLLGLFLALPLIVVARIWLKEVLIHDVLDPWQAEAKEKG